MNEYDISRAFKRIENDLMDSMMRNLKRHQAEETELGFEWEQWQALQLKELERYRKENAKLFTDDFKQINSKVEAMFKATCNDAQAKQENYILEQIKKGDFTPTQTKDTQFFNLNDDKLNILIERTKADFTRAEYAMLRKAEDEYRQIIFDAQVYANVTNDYAKAVDMATHDYVKNGIQCIQYKGWTDKNGKYHKGAVHDITTYAEMCVRTGNKRAYLMGEGNAHDKYGVHTVRVNKRTQACPKCVGFLGRVLVDDVYGGGTRQEALKLNVPTLSDAIQAGFLHPNCKDIYSLYIPDISRPPKPWTQEEINEIVGDYNKEQAITHAVDMAESYRRLSKYALDPTNAQLYGQRADVWEARAEELGAEPPKPVEPPIEPPAPAPVPIETLAEKQGVFLQPRLLKDFSEDEVRTMLGKVEEVYNYFGIDPEKHKLVYTLASDPKLEDYFATASTGTDRVIHLNPHSSILRSDNFDTVYHELGHLIDIELSETLTGKDGSEVANRIINDAYKQFKKTHQGVSKEHAILSISNYANTTSREAISDAIRNHFTGNQNDMSEAVTDTLKKYVDKHINGTTKIVDKVDEVAEEVVEQVAEQPKAFIPAKTIAEAEEYAKRFTDTSRFGALGVSYEGVSVDVANIINKTVDDFYKAYGVEPFGGIIAPKGNTKLGKQISGATAGYSPIRHSFILNRKSLKDVKTAEEGLKAQFDAVRKILEHPERYDLSKINTVARKAIEASAESGRATVPMTIEEVIWHELGHSLEKGVGKADNIDLIKANMPKYAPKLSGYAQSNFGEYIAESFCSYQKGEGLTDPELVKVFESLRR